MEKVACEVCNSSHIVKDGNYFVCESCGTRYKTEDLRKMILGVVEVIPGEKTLEKLYDDATFYLSINKLDEALEAFQRITKDYPKEYKPWIGMSRIRISQCYEHNEVLPTLEESFINEALLRNAPYTEVESYLYAIFNEMKEKEADDTIPEYYDRKDFEVQNVGNTTLIKMWDNGEQFYIYVPKGFKIYKQFTNWFFRNWTYFYVVARNIGCESYVDELFSYRKKLSLEGVFLYIFQNHFFSSVGYYNYWNFINEHNKRFVNGKEIGINDNFEASDNEVIEYKRDLDVRKLYLDVFNEAQIDFEIEKKYENFRDPDLLNDFFYKKYILFNYLIFKRSKISSSYGYSYYMCLYLRDTDIKGPRVKDYMNKYIEQRKEAKNREVCPWCGKTIDYSNLPITCDECKTIIEDI